MTDQDIINLRSADPFADVTGFNQKESGATGGASGQRSSNIIHIRIQQRSGKKTLTTVQVCLFFHRSIDFWFCSSISRVSVKNSIKNVFSVHSKRNLHVTELLLNIKNTAKSFNFKAINVPMWVNFSPKLVYVKLNNSKFTDSEQSSNQFIITVLLTLSINTSY